MRSLRMLRAGAMLVLMNTAPTVTSRYSRGTMLPANADQWQFMEKRRRTGILHHLIEVVHLLALLKLVDQEELQVTQIVRHVHVCADVTPCGECGVAHRAGSRTWARAAMCAARPAWSTRASDPQSVSRRPATCECPDVRMDRHTRLRFIWKALALTWFSASSSSFSWSSAEMSAAAMGACARQIRIFAD